MDYIRRVIFGTLHELWQALKKRAAAVIIAMLLPVIYEFLSLTTCKPLNHVENGSIECVGNWYNNSVGAVCSFSCKKGFQLVGAVKTTCNEEGNWTNGLPSCLKICDEPPKVLHGEVECNGTVVGSACRVKCDKSRKTDGVNLMLCGKHGRWLETAPTCVCANPCRTGENCDKFLTWQEFKHYINEDGGTSYLNFGGHPIKCATHYSIRRLKLDWFCRCIDITSGHEVMCKPYESRYGACEHSSAELIRQMVDKKVYLPPCDPHSLMTGC